MPWLEIMILIITIPLLIASIWMIAPWVPTANDDLEKVNQISDLKPNQTFLEIGSGSGRVSRYIARMNPKSNIIGIELFWPLWLQSKLSVIGMKRKPLFQLKNAFWYDMRNADVIYLFSIPKSQEGKFIEKIWSEMKPGSCIIAYVFKFSKWPGEMKIHTFQNKPKLKIYQYFKT